MQISDTYSQAPSGLFLLNVFRRGQLVETISERNLIVDNSKQIHAKLLGGSVSGQSVTTIGFGTSGTAPAAGNTSLTGAFTKAIDTVTYPATNQVSFNFSLASGENNGMAILEFGLITSGAALYARKIRASALNKASDISLSGSWVITF